MTFTPEASLTPAPLELLGRMMAGYPCYAFVTNDDCTGAKALFRGRWTWDAVSDYLSAKPTTVVVTDERASGFMRFRLYGVTDACPVCLAEIEVYFSRAVRTTFWCETGVDAGALSMAA